MTERKRIVSFGSNGGSFAPTAWWTIRNGAELVGDGFPFVITSDALERLVGEHEEIGIGETIEATREFIVRRVIGTSLGAQRMILFPIRIDYPEDEAGIRWDKDIAHGHIAHTLRSLASATTDPISELSDDSIRRQVADVVLVSIERLAEHIPQHRIDEGERDGMLERDAALADELEQIGQHGRERAALVRESAKRRFANRDDLLAYFSLWLPDGFLESEFVDGLPWIRALGRAAWFDVVLPKLEREAKRSTLVATIPAFVAVDLRNIAGAKHAELASADSSGSTRLYVDGLATNLVLASLQGIKAIAAERLIELASEAYFWPTLHWIAATVRDQEFSGVADPHIIRVEGGKEGLRRAIGGSKDGGAEGIWSVLSALHLLSSASEPGTARMLTLIEQRRPGPNGGRPISITVIEVHLLMRPRAAKTLRLHFSDWSLPVFDPGLVRTIGDHRTKGRQINAAQSLALHIHDHRRDVASDGSFVLTKKQWIDHGNRAGLYDRSHASLRDRYFDALQEHPDRQRVLAFGRSVGTEPMLVRVGPDRYRLGDSFAPEWDHFAEQGKLSLTSSAAGKKSARKRAAQVERALNPRTRRPRR